MAIRNNKDLIGGSDWSTGQALTSIDLNDTFDEYYTVFQWQ